MFQHLSGVALPFYEIRFGTFILIANWTEEGIYSSKITQEVRGENTLTFQWDNSMRVTGLPGCSDNVSAVQLFEVREHYGIQSEPVGEPVG